MSATIEMEAKRERKNAVAGRSGDKTTVGAVAVTKEGRLLGSLTVTNEAKSSVHVAAVSKEAKSSVHVAAVSKEAKSSVHAAAVSKEAKSSVHVAAVSKEAKSSVHAATVSKEAKLSVHAAAVSKEAKQPTRTTVTKEAQPPSSALSSTTANATARSVQDAYTTNTDRDLLRQAITEVPLMTANISCEQALELFTQQPKHECAVVIDELRRPIGLLMRNALFVKLSVPLMRDLFSHRPVTRLVDANPLTVDLKADVQHIVQQALSRTGIHLYDCVIVCDGAVVKGVLTMSSLLHLSTALQNKLKQQQRTLIDSSQQSITTIVGEVEKVHKTVQASESKFAAMVDMTLAGKNMLSRLTEAMSSISNNAKGQQDLMEQLQRSATMIQKVSGLVQEISEQSNLLAINATIEAAHAGSYGRSFSVVATEMMNLANESKTYAVQIKEAIQQMVNGIENTRQHSQQGALLGKQSDELIVNAEKIFQELFNMVAQSKQELNQIDIQATLASEQAQMTMHELSKLMKLQQ